MIILVTYLEKNERTGKLERVVSHGVDTGNLRNVPLPNVPVHEIGKFSESMDEWILVEEDEEKDEERK